MADLIPGARRPAVRTFACNLLKSTTEIGAFHRHKPRSSRFPRLLRGVVQHVPIAIHSV